MKKIIVLLCLSLIKQADIKSQIHKGSIMLGGDLSFYLNNQEFNGIRSHNTVFNIEPVAGKSIRENIILGGYFGIRITNSQGNNNAIELNDGVYSAGVFLRKYGVIKNNLFGFLQGNFGVGYQHQDILQNTFVRENTRRISVSASLSPGLSYMVSKKLHLEAGLRDVISLGYSKQKSTFIGNQVNNNSNSNSFNLNTSLNNFNSNFRIGFRILLSKK